MNQEIQALRAIAIIFVFISHLHGLFFWNEDYWNSVGKGLWIGVDLFFCISGFVIGKSLIPRLKKSDGILFWREAIAFWIRRLYRITPSAWLWLIIPFMIGPFLITVKAATLNSANFADIASALLHVVNFHYYSCTIGGGFCGIFPTYWSLSLEEQFYILLPLVFLLFKKHFNSALILLVLAQIFLTRQHWHGISSFIRTDAILLGALLSIFFSSENYILFEPNLNKSRFRFFITPVLIFSLVAITRFEIVQFFIGLAALVCALMVWLCSYDKGYFLKNKLLLSILSWIGARSFAIYLCHIPMFWVTREIWAQIEIENFKFDESFTKLFFITATILTLIISDLNYRFIEEPFRKIGKLHANKLLKK